MSQGQPDGKEHMGPFYRFILSAYYVVLLAGLVVALFALWPPSDLRAAVAANPAGSANVTLSFFGAGPTAPVSYDHVLLMLALVAGALGSLVHGITSLARYRGSKRLYQSWFLWYLSLPPVGALLGMSVYGLLGGGLLVLSGSAVLNPPTILAIGFLSGMFSKDLIPKLAEIFGDLLKTREKLPDGLGSVPVITRVALGAEVGGKVQVDLTGRGFDKGATLKVGEATHALEVEDDGLRARAQVPVQEARLATVFRVDTPTATGQPFVIPLVSLTPKTPEDVDAALAELEAKKNALADLRSKLGKGPGA